MTIYRLEVRVDQERRRKFRRLIDKPYEETQLTRRRRAAQELSQLAIGDVPDPAVLGRQLENAHGHAGIH